MNFTFNETGGDKPVSGWVALKVTEFVKAKYGLDVRITIREPYSHPSTSVRSDEPRAMISTLKDERS